MKSWKKVLLVGALAVIAPTIAGTAGAAMFVAPTANANTGGGAQGKDPFNGHEQIVYSSSIFGTGSETITAISFRPYTGNGGFSSSDVITNVQISLSTTPLLDGKNGTTALSATFANNLGSNLSTVYSGPLTLTTTSNVTNGNTQNFDYTINLQTPYVYNPASGNLLLDVDLPSGASGSFLFTTFDEVNTLEEINQNDGVYAVESNTDAGTTGTVGSSFAVTQFTTAAVPEPASVGLLAVGGALMLRRRNRQI